MANPESIPFLTEELRSFLSELDTLRRQIVKRQTGGAGAGSADVPDDPQAIRAGLAGALHQQEADAKRAGYDAKSLDFQQSQYVSAAVADATLNGFDWWGRGVAKPLTDDFPPPPGVSTDVVQQMKDVVAADPPRPEMAEIYVLALAAGLPVPAGTDPAVLADLRQQLLQQVRRQRPELSQPPPSLLFPDAYARAQSRGPALYLPQLRGWWLALGAVLVALALASDFVFRISTQDAVAALHQVLKLLG